MFPDCPGCPIEDANRAIAVTGDPPEYTAAYCAEIRVFVQVLIPAITQWALSGNLKEQGSTSSWREGDVLRSAQSGDLPRSYNAASGRQASPRQTASCTEEGRCHPATLQKREEAIRTLLKYSVLLQMPAKLPLVPISFRGS